MLSNSPQRLAWTVLLASFLTCCALTIGVPAAATSFVNSSTYTAQINVKLQAGRTNAFSPPATEADARVVDQNGRGLDEGGVIIVDSAIPSQAQLTIRETDGVTETLLTMQLYSGARVRVDRARIPRFDIARSPIDIAITVLDGRVEIQNQHPEGPGERELKLVVRSEHVIAALSQGAYSFEVASEETGVFVREGIAQVTSTAKPETVNIEANQRTVIHLGEGVVTGLYAPPRDLVRNGHFQAPLAKDWEVFSELYVPTEMAGAVKVLGSGANTSLLLDRPGAGLNWGRTGIKQTINENVSGRSSLQLRVNFTILYQELMVCGSQGSECPLMVKINYQREDGGIVDWTQGFYANGTPQMPELPDFIVQSAEPRTKHIATRLGVAEPYVSPNLLTTIKGLQHVNFIEIYAEGHGLETQVNSVELLVLD
jgi:hypothetical protein